MSRVGGFDLRNDFLKTAVGFTNTQPNRIYHRWSSWNVLIHLLLAALRARAFTWFLVILDRKKLFKSMITCTA
jgi:hypothetical protein